MKYIGIETPCSENFHSMLPNAQGSYCVHCEKNVIDFSVKSDHEIIDIIQLNDQLCGRFSVEQLERMNKDLDTYSFQSEKSFKSALVFSLFVVFGLTLFSCNDAKQQKEVEAFQKELKETYLSEKPNLPEMENKTVFTKLPIPVAEELVLYEMEEAVSLELTPDTIAIDEVIIHGEIRRESFVVGRLISTMSINTVDAVRVEYDRNGMIVPTEFSSTAFPNPTSDNTTFEIKLPSKEKFEIGLYDMNGKLLREIYSGKIDRGTFQQQVEMSELPQGIYLITIVSKAYKATVRVSKI